MSKRVSERVREREERESKLRDFLKIREREYSKTEIERGEREVEREVERKRVYKREKYIEIIEKIETMKERKG